MKKFDLNIEKILENWEIHHAIREIIANAIDEQILTKTKEVDIFRNGNSWIIRDYGRGLNIPNLTQNENNEKLSNVHVIGKFGIGLKDALATFDRKGIVVTAKSKHCCISMAKSQKQGFQDISTLHAIIEEHTEFDFLGTEFTLVGIADKDIELAKQLFLQFSGEQIIETTKHGQIIMKGNNCGNIYINGVKVAEEENFLFSYNITTLTSIIKKSLNRERTNVGRTAYSDSVKKILLSSAKNQVAEILGKDLANINKGTAHDELSWIDVQEHAVKILNQDRKFIFVTASELLQNRDMVDQAKDFGHETIVIPENLKLKIHNSKDLSGNPIVDLSQFVKNYNDSFEFNFVEPDKLTDHEMSVYQLTPKILKLFGAIPIEVKEVKISSTMKKNFLESVETLGCWDEKSNSIIISKKCLLSIAVYSGTMIHELIHAKTGYDDVTRSFEYALTEKIGDLCQHLIQVDELKVSAPVKGHAEISKTSPDNGKVKVYKRPWYKIFR